MVQRNIRYKKGIAIELRKKGFSYSEIENAISIPKSTIALWVKKIKLNPDQLQRLSRKQFRAAKESAKKKALKFSEEITKARASSLNDIKKISAREFWLMGVVLYWRTLTSQNISKAVKITSGDPNVIKFFLLWLQEIGKISKKEIFLDIFVGKGGIAKKSRKYWAEITGWPEKSFSRIYRYRNRFSTAVPFGLIQIRVSGSSVLAQQLLGWIEGIQREIKYVR